MFYIGQTLFQGFKKDEIEEVTRIFQEYFSGGNLVSVVFSSSKARGNGRARWTSKRDGSDMRYYVTINRRSVSWQATLVHELTHIRQYVTGKIAAIPMLKMNAEAEARLGADDYLGYLGQSQEIEAYHEQAKYLRRMGLDPVQMLHSYKFYAVCFNLNIETLMPYKVN